MATNILDTIDLRNLGLKIGQKRPILVQLNCVPYSVLYESKDDMYHIEIILCSVGGKI